MITWLVGVWEGRGEVRKRSHWVADRMGGGAKMSPFTLCWTSGMLTGYSANLVRAGSHAETGRGWGRYRMCVCMGGAGGGCPMAGG